MSTTNPKNYLELLKVFHLALTNGLIDKLEIIKWADEIINKDTEPDYFIIELSLCGHKDLNEMIHLLSEYIGERGNKISGRVILGFMHRQYLNGQITLKKVAHSTNWLIWQADLTEEEKSLMYGLDEDYDCAEEKIYGAVEDIEMEVLRFIEIYKDFRIDNFTVWPEINKTINRKVQLLTEIVKSGRQEFLKSQTKKKWWEIWKN